MSKIVVFDQYGDPGVLQVVERDPPHAGAGEIRVRVHAAGVQPFDALFRSGAARQWVPARFPQPLGNEFSGVVDEVGQGVTGVQPGDAVLGWAMLSSYAEHVVIGAEQVVRKPASMPWEDAAVLSASGQTASTALAALRVGPGDTVLIHAAAGGVGSFAVQMATAAGATVIGTASTRNHEYVRSLGATPVRYGDGLVDRVRAIAPAGIDAALVAVDSEEALRSSLDLVPESNRVGTVAYQPLAAELGVRRISTERSAARLRELTRLYDGGALRVFLQQRYRLEDAADTHRAIATGHVRGKLVLVTGDAGATR